MNLFEAINERHSVRTFTGQMPAREIMDKIELPAGKNYRITCVESGISGGIGSYGIIKDAPAWLALISDGSDYAKLRCAMEAERIVLYLTSQGVGTCWVGGTFNSSDAGQKAGIHDQEKIDAVIPFGYAATHKRFIERVTSALAHSSKRKEFDKLFDIDKEAPAVYRDILEAVRMAPSAVNAQPWRIKVDMDGNAFFSSASDNAYTMLDMGIALEHFKIAAEKYGIKGSLEIPSMPKPQLIARWIAANS